MFRAGLKLLLWGGLLQVILLARGTSLLADDEIESELSFRDPQFNESQHEFRFIEPLRRSTESSARTVI